MPIVCAHCDAAHAARTPKSFETLRCTRCGAVLARGHRMSRQGLLALTLAAAATYAIALLNPLVTVQLSGREAEPTLPGAIADTWMQGEALVALVAAATALVAPGLLIALRLAALRGSRDVERWIRHLEAWSMVEVLLVGALIAVVRVAALAGAEAGPGLYAFGALMLLLAAIQAAAQAPDPGIAAPPHPHSVQNTWALLIAAAAMSLPANLLPVMTTQSVTGSESHTIAGGIVELWHTGSESLALIVFVASLVVPGLKILALALLAWSVRRPSDWRRGERAALYRVVEAVGHWSMLDVYVVVLLVAFVPFGALAQVEMEPGMLAFAAVVVLTMLAAQQFDARLIWQDAPQDG